MNKYSLHNLKNGLKVVLMPNNSTSAVTTLVLFKVGSRHESANINGISHFIEHMMFKGTKKRPNTIDISKALDGIGAEYNAFTGKDMTGYYIKSSAENIELSIDMLSDILLNSKFDRKELERERGVIIEEINMYEDTPKINIENYFEGLMYQGNPLARSIIGPKKNISRVKRQDLINYLNKHYKAENMVIAIAGQLRENKTLDLINKYFGKFSNDKKAMELKLFKASQAVQRVKFVHKKTEQAHLNLGFLGFSDTDPRTPALKLLTVILGAGMSSRLFIEARERRGLCYYIRAETINFEDTGHLLIKAGFDIKRLEQAVAVILKELKKIKKEIVKQNELKKAKEYIKGTTILSLEDSEAQAGYYAREALFKEKIKTPSQKLREIQKVTTNDIKSVAQEILQKNKLNLAVIGLFKSKDEIKINKIKNLLKL